jgi:dipeptidase D
MPPSFESLQPQRLWYWFGEICRVPRASGNESAATELVVDFARDLGLSWKRDDAGNVIIYKPGAGLAFDSLPLLVQAHLDMVPEKLASSRHDFRTDPVIPEVESDWVFARETTLGADNGIGVALMLALLEDDDAQHPPLECLFTVDEERGLTGAGQLDPSWLSSRRMINLDSESEGRFCIGCAGGVDVKIDMPLSTSAPAAGSIACTVIVDGLRGGHSGMEIGRSRASAIRILARTLARMSSSAGVSVAGISGGSKRNAIPRTATATMVVPGSKADLCLEIAAAIRREQRAEYAAIEPSMELVFKPSDMPVSKVLTPDSARRAIDILLALPHGVEKMSGLEGGLVETSVNMATVDLEDETLSIVLTVRSLLEEAKFGLAERILAVARLAGCPCSTGGGYPGWRPDPVSPLLKAASAAWKEFSGKEAAVETVHAGLECGIIGNKLGGMDMISMGPDIRDVHVPGEKVSISSTARFWSFFRSLLAKL